MCILALVWSIRQKYMCLTHNVDVCRPSQWCPPPRCLTLWWSPTMPRCQCTSLWRMRMSAWCWTMRPCTTSASAPSSSPHPPLATSTTLSLPSCPASPAACVSQVTCPAIRLDDARGHYILGSPPCLFSLPACISHRCLLASLWHES